jgi:hypothetical protein
MGAKKRFHWYEILIILSLLFLVTACGGKNSYNVYIDPNMDFGVIKVVAVMPFVNLARDPVVADRVRDVLVNKLLATGSVYVLPVGEVARGTARAEIPNPSTPSQEEIIKLGGIIKAQAVIMGAVREYGEVRSGTSSGNIISLSLQMVETQTGKIVWTASSTQGGISVWARLFGGGGKPMNVVTEKAVDDLLSKLLK